MKGVPVRVEIGPKDMEKEQCVIARRDTGEKITVALAELESAVKALLDHIHDNLYAMALKNREDNTFDIQTPEEAKAIVEGKGGFLRSKWCGSLECELAMKERGRCQLPLYAPGPERHGGHLPLCGRKCTTDIYWGVAKERGRGNPPLFFFKSREEGTPIFFKYWKKRKGPTTKKISFYKKKKKK